MRIAFAGNPNSGKTTMYNTLTGRNEKVGNWAGVTVDKKEALIKKAFRLSALVSIPQDIGHPTIATKSRSKMAPLKDLRLKR